MASLSPDADPHLSPEVDRGASSSLSGQARGGDRVFVATLALIAALIAIRYWALWADFVPLSGDEAQYWTYGRDLDLGYFSKPPLAAWLIGLSSVFFGDAAFGIRALYPLLHLAIAGVLYAIARRWLPRTDAALVALAYLALPAVALSSLVASTDPPMLLAWVVCLWALARLRARDDMVAWAALAAAFALGLMSKYTIVAILPAILFATIPPPEDGRGRRWTRAAIALALFALLIAPHAWWSLANDFPTARHVGANASLDGFVLRWDELLKFWLSQLGVMGPLLALAAIAVFAAPALRRNAPRFWLFALSSLPLFSAISAQALMSRANANWAAPALLGFLLIAAIALLRSGPRARAFFHWGVGLNLALGLLLYAVALVHAQAGVSLSGATDPFRKMRGHDQLSAQVAELLAERPDHRIMMDHRMSFALVLHAGDLPLARGVKWNPDATIDDHYEMTTALSDDPAQPYLLVTRRPEPRAILARFDKVEALAPLMVETHADRAETWWVYALEGLNDPDEDAR